MGLNNLITIEQNNIDKKKKIEIRKIISSMKTKIEYLDIKKVDANKFTGDFYGLLNVYNIPRLLWFEIMALNDIKSSSSFDGKLYRIKIFDIEVMKKILRIP